MSMGMPIATNSAVLFSKISKIGHLFQLWKEIQLGPGLMIQNENFYSRLDWKHVKEDTLNVQTREWFLKAKDKLSPCGRYVLSSPGMLMGMLNAASTTVGLLPMNYKMPRNYMKMVCMRSSDDSTTKYLSNSSDTNKECVVKNKQNLSLIGINLSPDKTFFLPEGRAEYTSWYIDGRFVSQYGTEVPNLRPQGKNPYDDLYSIAKGTATALSTLTINHLGATARLRIGIANCKRLWRLPELGSNLRENVSLDVQMIEDGGHNLWNCANCHLNEIAMKFMLVKNDDEELYFQRILNPDSPFSGEIEEELSYSKEHGCLTWTPVETPNCIFRYVKRTNRSFQGEGKKIQAVKEKANSAVYELLNLADPTISLEFPTTAVSISTHLISIV